MRISLPAVLLCGSLMLVACGGGGESSPGLALPGPLEGKWKAPCEPPVGALNGIASQSRWEIVAVDKDAGRLVESQDGYNFACNGTPFSTREVGVIHFQIAGTKQAQGRTWTKIRMGERKELILLEGDTLFVSQQPRNFVLGEGPQVSRDVEGFPVSFTEYSLARSP